MAARIDIVREQVDVLLALGVAGMPDALVKLNRAVDHALAGTGSTGLLLHLHPTRVTVEFHTFDPRMEIAHIERVLRSILCLESVRGVIVHCLFFPLRASGEARRLDIMMTPYEGWESASWNTWLETMLMKSFPTPDPTWVKHFLVDTTLVSPTAWTTEIGRAWSRALVTDEILVWTNQSAKLTLTRFLSRTGRR